MKAFIFAAGLGTRLKPLTDRMPKALQSKAGQLTYEQCKQVIETANNKKK